MKKTRFIIYQILMPLIVISLPITSIILLNFTATKTTNVNTTDICNEIVTLSMILLAFSFSNLLNRTYKSNVPINGLREGFQIFSIIMPILFAIILKIILFENANGTFTAIHVNKILNVSLLLLLSSVSVYVYHSTNVTVNNNNYQSVKIIIQIPETISKLVNKMLDSKWKVASVALLIYVIISFILTVITYFFQPFEVNTVNSAGVFSVWISLVVTFTQHLKK